MKKWIRWQGLGVFVGVIVVFCIFWFLFIDGIVESIIESYGSKAVGAKVELAGADLSLFPAGLELRGLQITNPDEPMKNAVEIKRAKLGFDTLNFFRRKLIVEQMSLEGIRLNTPRKSTGALPGLEARKKARKAVPTKGKKKKSICEGGGLPSLEMPDINTILSKEKIPSVELVASLKSSIEKEKQKWQQRLASLPNQKTFASYKKEIEQLKRGRGGLAGLMASGGKALELKKKIQADINRIKQAKAQFQKEKAQLEKKISEAQKAPFKDASRLAQKYGMSKEGLANLSSLLFGAKICGWMEKAANWYQRIRPFLERAKRKKNGKQVVKPLRGKGTYVRFKERQPLPDLLVKQATASVVTSAGDISGIIKNITPDQDILGLPLTFVFKGEKLKGFKALETKGRLNHVRPDSPRDEIRLLVKGFQAQAIPLLENKRTPVMLNHALADLNIKALVQGKKIDANVVAAVRSAALSVKGQANKSPIMEAILSSLKHVSAFIVNAKVTGTLDDYAISLSSDLEGILQKSAGKIIARQTQALRSKLAQAISSKVEKPLGEAQGGLAGLGSIDKELANRLNLGSGLLGNLGKSGGRSKGFKLPFSS